MNHISTDQSKEDYLKAILALITIKGACRVTDIADYLGFSKASVSVALKKLEGSGLVIRDGWRILLTEDGEAIARGIQEKHLFFTDLFTACGVDPQVAESEACLVEHAISDSSFRLLKARLRSLSDGIR